MTNVSLCPVTCLSQARWRMMFLSRTGHWTLDTLHGAEPRSGQETGSAKPRQQLETVKGFKSAGYAK